MRILIATICLLFLNPSVLTAQFRDCPGCGNKVAVGVPENTKVKKKVYEVECKEIAVPDICLPRPLFILRDQLARLRAPKCVPGSPCGCDSGECTCEPIRHGHVRTIKVLKKKTVECQSCAYKWEVTDPFLCDQQPCDALPFEAEALPAQQSQNKMPLPPILEVEKTEPTEQQPVQLNLSDRGRGPKPVYFPGSTVKAAYAKQPVIQK